MALEVGGKKALSGKSKKGEYVFYDPKKEQDEGKPSKINHGNITPSLIDNNTKQPLPGGFTISKAIQTTVLSLAAIRRLHFPINGQEPSNETAQTVLATLGLLAAVLTRQEGADLRSRCQLIPVQKFIWELIDIPGSEPRQFELNADTAIEIFNQAVNQAKESKLPWEKTIELSPKPELIELVARSQELTAQSATEEGA